MRQARMMSFVEAVATVAVGYGVAVATRLIVRPTFGIAVTLEQSLAIGGVLTLVSPARSYLLRRLFEGAAERTSLTQARARNAPGPVSHRLRNF